MEVEGRANRISAKNQNNAAREGERGCGRAGVRAYGRGVLRVMSRAGTAETVVRDRKAKCEHGEVAGMEEGGCGEGGEVEFFLSSPPHFGLFPLVTISKTGHS